MAQALLAGTDAALQVITVGMRPRSCKRHNRQCLVWLRPFSHALMAALLVVTGDLRPQRCKKLNRCPAVVAKALLACTDGRIAGDNLGHEATELQETLQMQCLLWLWPFSHALMAIVGENLGHEASVLQET